MTEAALSNDPRFQQFVAARHSDPLNQNITCYGYAVADDATIDAYVNRPASKLWRPPQIGDAYGIDVKMYGILNRVTSDVLCDFVEKDGLRRLPTPEVGDKLPAASEGHRLVAVLYGMRNGQMEYHTLREWGGIWSHKFGKTSKPSVHDARGQLITDPRQARFYDMQQGPFFFEVPTAGIDLRLNPQYEALSERINEAHNDMGEQAKKRRVNFVRPSLAHDFRKLSELVEPVSPEFSRQLGMLVTLHTTGKAPEGIKLRQGIFKPGP